MKTSEVFKLVKENLQKPREVSSFRTFDSEGRSPLICITLNHLLSKRLITWADKERCTNIVRVSLDLNPTLETWLINNKHCTPEDIKYPRSLETTQKLYNTRQAWLDWLIQKYQSQND
jgi:hypothetical protein